MTDRKALTRTQIITLCQRQTEAPILCGCGCGVALDPVNERVVDEHVLPRKLTEQGCEGERDIIDNRAFYRWPCALEKTKADLATIAKAKAQGGETGQYARRQKRGGSSIKGRPGGGWPPKGSVKLPSKKRLQGVTALDDRDDRYGAEGGVNT
ncbi:hypothetical protein [Brevundimonas sp. NIBR11]|uniref:hypothetical protein n=1 Tax=Brevundimonas sp. NIBR11 TaxID=3015999 RepID=UPI0022EFFB3C|nr:hypothetical protein [Brevundimonas sp. NIBR11]WGM31462.1 hypothetical protein KKHFBJBL_01709 [Brevundimonas sp. NIBR11]